jgi:hypothetical protein
MQICSHRGCRHSYTRWQPCRRPEHSKFYTSCSQFWMLLFMCISRQGRTGVVVGMSVVSFPLYILHSYYVFHADISLANIHTTIEWFHTIFHTVSNEKSWSFVYQRELDLHRSRQRLHRGSMWSGSWALEASFHFFFFETNIPSTLTSFSEISPTPQTGGIFRTAHLTNRLASYSELRVLDYAYPHAFYNLYPAIITSSSPFPCYLD